MTTSRSSGVWCVLHRQTKRLISVHESRKGARNKRNYRERLNGGRLKGMLLVSWWEVGE